MKYFEQIIQIRIEYVVTRVREAPGRFGQSHSIPLWDRARFRNRDIIELYIGPGLSLHCWKYVRSSFLGWLVNQLVNRILSEVRFVDLQPAATNQHGQTKRKIQISPFSKPQNALWRQNLDAHLIGGRIWGGNRGLEISCHLYTQGTPATHRYLCLNWISLSIPTIFELSFVEDLSVFNLYSLPARLFWFPRRVRRR